MMTADNGVPKASAVPAPFSAEAWNQLDYWVGRASELDVLEAKSRTLRAGLSEGASDYTTHNRLLCLTEYLIQSTRQVWLGLYPEVVDEDTRFVFISDDAEQIGERKREACQLLIETIESARATLTEICADLGLPLVMSDEAMPASAKN